MSCCHPDSRIPSCSTSSGASELKTEAGCDEVHDGGIDHVVASRASSCPRSVRPI